MRPKEITITPVDADPDGLAEAQLASAGAAVTLGGALISDSTYTADYPRILGVLSAADDSGITFTVTGTDPDNKVLTEAVTGSTGGTATTSGYFKTVSSVVPSGDSAGNVSVGTEDELTTNTIPIETRNNKAATVSLERVSGTLSAKVQETFSRLQYTDTIVFYDSPLGNTGSNIHEDMSTHASGIRPVLNSYSSGASLRVIINQNRQT